jgi:thioredoxin 1
MSYQATHLITAPERSAVDVLPGTTLLEFGTPWCGHCQRAQPLIAQALAEAPEATHLKVEDGPGRSLGRSYRVKLWPTLIVLRDGQEVARLVRPDSQQDIAQALAAAR